MPALYLLNPEFIFYFESNELIVIDPVSQRTFKIYDKVYVQRLFDISLDSTLIDHAHPIDHLFIQAGLLLEKDGADRDGAWQGDKLSKLCHQASRNLSHQYHHLSKENVKDFLFQLADDIEEIPDHFEPPFVGEKIKLPEPNLEELKSVSLDTALRQRKTCREFYGTPISLEKLSTLLHYGLGYIHGQEWDEFSHSNFISLGERKSSPSSSGLQACDAFLVVMNVQGLEQGVYFYNARNHSVQKVGDAVSNDLLASLVFDQFWMEGIAVGLFLTIDLRRIWIKDKKPRGYVTGYIECGHVSQTIQLISAVLGLQTWITGSFRDDLLGQVLNIQEEFIFPSFFLGIGYGSGKAIPAAFRET